MKLAICVVFLLITTRAAFGNNSEISQLFKTLKVKDGLLKPAKGFLKHDYLVAQSSGVYYQLFDWDTYFIGIALGYDKNGTALQSSVENFLEYVGENASEDGYVPREIGPEGFWALPEMAKPFLAQEVLFASQIEGDFSWLQEYYDRLKLTLNYWEKSRRAKDGLFLWYNGRESGADNNPAVIDLPATVTEGVDLQVYMYREYLAMSTIAHQLKKTPDEIHFRESADLLSKLVNSRMWSEREGLFYNIDSRTGKKIKIKTWSSLTPLWGKMVSSSRAKRLIEKHLLNPLEFWSLSGVRTLSQTEKLYDPVEGYWRGPVWIISNYLLMHGLLNYGYIPQAKELAKKTTALLIFDIHESHGMHECYNPETGDSEGEGQFIDWNLLAEHMEEEATSGFNPTSLL